MEAPRETLGETSVCKSKKKISICDLHLLDFKTRLKYSIRYSPYFILEEFQRSDNQEIYLEEMRKHNQWKLARQVKKRTALRLGVGRSGTPDSPDKKVAAKRYLLDAVTRGSDSSGDSDSDEEDANPGELKLATKESRLIKLSDITIHLDGGRYRETTGTLEAHVNGFRYSTFSANFQLDFMYYDIKHSFFQVDEEKMMPLLHLHFYDDIMVGTEKTKNIQFHFVHTLAGRKRYVDGSDKIEEENQKRDMGIVKDFRKFVYEVEAIWDSLPKVMLPIDPPVRRCEFHGVPHSKTMSVFAVTMFCLIQLAETPFVVVTLSEIEIVNLAQVGAGQIDMTVVFKDFRPDLLKIRSIALASLTGIKKWLNIADVKYYENNEYDGWETMGKEITDDPKKFIDNGGWEFLNPDEASSDSDSGGWEVLNPDEASSSDSDNL